MSYKNKRQSVSSFQRKWAINKNHAKPSFNRSMFKTLSKLSVQRSNSPARPQVMKTLPTQYDRSPSPNPQPSIKPDTVPIQNPEACPAPQFQSVEQAEARIDILLKQKLKLLISINKHKFFNKCRNATAIQKDLVQSIIKLNDEIQTLVESIKINMNNRQISDNMDRWAELDRKIKMLEKVMAENDSEVEIMKKYYTKVSHNVTTYRKFCQSPQGEVLNRIKNALAVPKYKKPTIDIIPKLPCGSTNNITYKLPNVDDYQKYRYSQAKPDNNHQSIIRLSAYRTSFRPYAPPNVPLMSRRYSSLSIRPPSRQQTSSYKDQFKPVKEKRVNFKELDCFKDKFRRLNVTCNQRSQSVSVDEIAEYIKLQKISINSNDSLVNSRIQTVPTPRSTCKVDYSKIDDKQRRMYAARPKNSRLNFLRGSFKRLINED